MTQEQQAGPSPLAKAQLVMDWITAQGVGDEHSCDVALVGCYRIKPHREGWLALSLESRLAGPRVLVICDRVDELKTFAASHARMMLESTNPSDREQTR